MRAKKGLLTEYIKIITLFLLIGILIYEGYKFIANSYNNESFETIKTNLLSIQGKTEIITQKVKIKEKDAKYIGIPIKEKLEDEKIKKLIENNVIDIETKESNLYWLDNENLKELGLEEMEIESYYIVDYKKNDVIYVDGIKEKNENIIYKLSEMK